MTRTQPMIITLLLSFILFALPADPHAGMPPSQALSSAEQFLTILDNQQWEKAYQAAAAPLRLLNDKSEWIAEQQSARQLLGPPQQRQLTAVRSRDHYPGLPDGNYLIVLYTTRTPVKQKAREVLLLREGEGHWQVCKYSIR